jgi:L-lactate dehydrogenase complex protein LldG
MSNGARERILSNLRAAVSQGNFAVPETEVMPIAELSQEEKIAKLQCLMEAMHTEVYVVKAADWVAKLKEVLRKRQLKQLLYASDTELGNALEQAWEEDLPELTGYQEDVEQCKEKLFEMDASITSTKGGIAESGAVILWPTAQEPRLMSLVPTIHIAVLEADKIYNTLAEAMTQAHWQDGMPTNALLISGPSKTADIELTLTFGVHGPKELIVFILEKTASPVR